MGWLEVLLEFLSLIFVFALIVGLAYFTTKLVASSNLKKMRNKNMRVIEGLTIAPQKSLQLVKVGDKVMLIGITRDHIVKLETFCIDELEVSEKELDKSLLTFQDIFSNALKKEIDEEGKAKVKEKKKK